MIEDCVLALCDPNKTERSSADFPLHTVEIPWCMERPCPKIQLKTLPHTTFKNWSFLLVEPGAFPTPLGRHVNGRSSVAKEVPYNGH